MKTRLLIIIGVILIIAIASTFILNYYIDEEIKAQKFSDEQIDRIYKRCDYQKRMDDRNWIGLDGNKITDQQPLYIWNNSTHRIDNNICEWQTIEKYESDINFRNALDRCWTGNSEFLDDDFVLWSNETHYIDIDTCLITEAIHSGMSIGRTVYSVPFGMTQEELENQIPMDPIYIENPNNPGEMILNLDAILQVQEILEYCKKNKNGEVRKLPLLEYTNGTHHIDNNICEWRLLENYLNSDKLCIPGQYVENNEPRIRNGTHIYNNDACMWEILEICTGYCGEIENEK